MDAAQPRTGRSQLYVAAKRGQPGLVHRLLDARADPTRPELLTQSSPIHAAAHAGHREALALLLDEALHRRGGQFHLEFSHWN